MANPYAYEVIPPIGRLLSAISDHCSVGGTIRPRNRTLAEWANYASAGHIAPLLDQLACDGWILYDRTTGLITLLYDPAAGSIDPDADQMIPAGITFEEDEESALIPSPDRRFAHQNAVGDFDPAMDQTAQCMEDHVLVAAALDSESAAARSKIPCAADSIPPMDHRVVLLSELGTAPKLIAKALTKRPDLTPGQIRATWSHFEPRIKAGLCSAGAFHAAIANGQIHAAPPDPAAPIDPQSYAGRDDVMLGSDLPPPETIRDRAHSLLGPWTAENHAAQIRDSVFLQCRLGQGDSDEIALQALEKHRKAVRR
jgi:hypothetical protein